MKHPGLAIMLGMGPHKEEGEPGHDEGSDMSHEEHHKAMEDALYEAFDAVKAGDKEAFCKSLMAFVDLKMAAPEDEPSAADLHGDEDDEDEDSLKL
jgi:hypothetical protein